MKIIDSTPEILKSYRKSSASKRNRIKLTDEQKDALEAAFIENQHPSSDTKELLEYKYLIPMKNVQIWFQNRRAKQKSLEEQKLIKEKKRSKEKENYYKLQHEGNIHPNSNFYYTKKHTDDENNYY